MNTGFPGVILGFAKFLQETGLTLQRRETDAVFNNSVLQYGNINVGVRFVSDRGIWYIEIADPNDRPCDWYDIALLQRFLLGHGEDVLPLAQQIEFLKNHWHEVLSLFDSNHARVTRERLAQARKERTLRRFPGLRIDRGRFVEN